MLQSGMQWMGRGGRVGRWAVLAVMLGTACTTARGDRLETRPSGFLGDYSDFEASEQREGTLVYVNHDIDTSRFTRLTIDPVLVYFDPESMDYGPDRGIDPTELKELTDYFYDAVVRAVEDAYPVVEESGPDVLRVRIAITGVVPVNETVQLLTAAAMKMGLELGEASVEAEFVDSETGRRVYALVDKKAGARYKTLQGLNKWGHVKGAFEEWARAFRRQLDDMQGAGA